MDLNRHHFGFRWVWSLRKHKGLKENGHLVTTKQRGWVLCWFYMILERRMVDFEHVKHKLFLLMWLVTILSCVVFCHTNTSWMLLFCALCFSSTHLRWQFPLTWIIGLSVCSLADLVWMWPLAVGQIWIIRNINGMRSGTCRPCDCFIDALQQPKQIPAD